MNLGQLWSRLLGEGVGVWLDADSKLRIATDASPEMKLLVRENRTVVTDILKAQEIVNDSGVQAVRVMGGYAIAKAPGELPPEVASALRLLSMDGLPLVHNTEGRRWLDYESWRLQQVTARFDTLFDAGERQRWIEALHAERDEHLQSRRRRRSA